MLPNIFIYDFTCLGFDFLHDPKQNTISQPVYVVHPNN